MDKRLNIVFIPPKEIVDHSIRLCEEIKRENEVSFLLDGINNNPHVTIYQMVIPGWNLERLVEKLDQTIKNFNAQKFIFTDFQEHSGFLGASFKLTESIKRVQEEIVEQITELREGRNILEVNDPAVEDWPESHRQIVADYGFDNLFDFYNPHITITRLPDFEKARDLAGKLSWPFAEFESNSIGLCELGDFGTCNKLLKEFKLAAVN